MTIKEHEYVRQTLERYTNCSLEEFCDHLLITNFRQYMDTHLEIGIDAAAKLQSNWGDVEKRLHSEW